MARKHLHQYRPRCAVALHSATMTKLHWHNLASVSGTVAYNVLQGTQTT